MSAAIETDETLVIETPERVPLHFALASIGNRFIACAIDHTIQITALIVLGIVFAIISDVSDFGNQFSSMPKWAKALLYIFAFVVWNLVRLADIIVPPFYSIGLISVFATDRDQRIGDLVAGTVVVRERQAEAPAFTEVFASPISDPALRRSFKPVPFTADVNNLTEQEISVVESFLRRRWDLKDYPRQWMAWRVAMPILFKLRPQYDLAEFTYEGFLEELLHRYRERHRFID